ncbi:hypothetical protein Hamer_G009751, partial [Homarus americanus]
SANGERQPGQAQGGGGGGGPTRYVPSGPGSHTRRATEDRQQQQQSTIPAGNGGDVDYMRIGTPAPDPRQPPLPRHEPRFDPNESSGTMIRKFMEKNKQYRV